MRRLAVLSTAVALVVALAAVAYAAQVNTYTASGKTSPSAAGSKKKPVPVQLKFGYTVGEEGGQRPSPVKRYTIGFQGLQSNGGLFPKCSAQAINDAGDDSGCAKGSVVGTGFVKNAAGASANPADRSIPCNLNLKIYNSGQGKAALYLSGTPPQCAIPISQAIDAKYVKIPGGQALQFEVPANLLHPVAGIDNAVVEVTSTIKKMTKKSKGKTRGYYEVAGGCKGGKRGIEVSFLSEAGETKSAKGTASC
jgi:hypothetical protein